MSVKGISGSGGNLDHIIDGQQPKPSQSENVAAKERDLALNSSIPAGSAANQVAIKSGVAADKSQWQTYQGTATTKNITEFQKSASWAKSRDLAGKVGPENFPSNPYGSLGGFPLKGSEPNVALKGLDVSKQVGSGVIYAQGKIIAGESHQVLVNADFKNYGAIIGAEQKYGVDIAGEVGYQRDLGQALGQEIGVNVRTNANGFVGEEGAASAELSFKGGPKVTVGGEAFVGARARLQPTVGLRVNNSEVGSVHVGAEGWAGVGAQAHFDVGFHDGKLNFDMGAGAALGLGGEVDFGGSINLLGVLRAYQNSAVVQAISNTMSTVAASAGKVAAVVGDKIAAAGHTVASWVKSIF